jgi:glycosyltransferase involved in cell wall biosynthesis
MKKGYIPQKDRKKIFLLCDDIRMTSGIATMARELVVGTSHKFNWVNLGGAINHPESGKRLDISQDTNQHNQIEDASVFVYPINGYGSPEVVRQLIEIENPDAIMFFTDPRYWIWLFQMENEIRKKIPMIYLNIWDDLPAPLYNKSYYESCDTLLAISKQTENINRMVLGDKAKDKIIKYLPHGINEKIFYPINEYMKEDSEKLNQMRTKLFGEDQPEFVVFYNARNIRRKSVPDLIAAYADFCESIGKDKAKKCRLLMHTDPLDENGTDLPAVINLLCDPEYQKVTFSSGRTSAYDINLMYNISDVTALISSNEGWGLSLTEAMMCGKMIIATVTGGMQDQMKFMDENGEWISFTDKFPSNHFGKHKKCGEWAIPIYPSNLSLVGSIPTPYIWDDRADFRDVSKAIQEVYELPIEERIKRGLSAREWVQSDQANMSARKMCETFADTVNETFVNFKKRSTFELIKIEKLPRKKLTHPLKY